jgi:hypothetical protein
LVTLHKQFAEAEEGQARESLRGQIGALRNRSLRLSEEYMALFSAYSDEIERESERLSSSDF